MSNLSTTSGNNIDSKRRIIVNWIKNKSCILAFLVGTYLLFSVQAFCILGPKRSMKFNVVPLTEDTVSSEFFPNSTNKDEMTTNTNTPSLKFGSLLMQMQKKEVEFKKYNKSFQQEREADNVGENDVSDRQSAIDDEIAKELDDSVSIRITNSVKDITLLQLPEIYGIRMIVNDDKEENTNTKMNSIKERKTRPQKDNLPRLSRAEHYEGCIGRDMRHLAVSVASCIDDVTEWHLFCQQATGGLEPLIECIRVGAKSVREGNDKRTSLNGSDHYLVTSTSSSGLTIKEESFQAASSACRALRDLCALSLDLAVVITDGMLRANAAYQNKGEHTLMEDLCTILHHAGRRLRCRLYVTQLLLAMTCASDCAVDAIRSTEGLKDVLLVYSSYARKERRRRWMRYPGEIIKSIWLTKRKRKVSSLDNQITTTEHRRQPFIEAASLKDNLEGRIRGTTNQVLAAIGYNEWVPKIPGQKGLR